MSIVNFNTNTTSSYSIEPASKEEMMKIFENDILSTVPVDYFLKKDLIRNLLEDYSLQELQAIYKDYSLLKEKTFKNALKNQFPRHYIVTAGGPGAGKSTILEKYLSEHSGFAYIDPDRTCLLHMENTYKKDIEDNKTPQNSYTKWRNASNFIANILMCTALKEGYNVAHGSTMTSVYSKLELDAVKKYGYNRKILHISCPDEVRIASEKRRKEEEGIVQCTDEDLMNKGKDFFKRLDDYLISAEEIIFYFRSDMTTVSKIATKTLGIIEITNIENFQKIKEMHNVAMEDENYWDRYN